MLARSVATAAGARWRQHRRPMGHAGAVGVDADRTGGRFCRCGLACRIAPFLAASPFAVCALILRGWLFGLVRFAPVGPVGATLATGGFRLSGGNFMSDAPNIGLRPTDASSRDTDLSPASPGGIPS